jgi:hypothetical protein
VNLFRIKRRSKLLITSPFAVLASMALMLIAGAGLASANEERSFCTGVTLNYEETCSSATYPDLFAAYGSSPTGSVCVFLSTGELRAACSPGVNQGAYVSFRSGESYKGHAFLYAPGETIKASGALWRKSWAEDNLGGTISSDADIASWSENRLDVFASGVESALWHKYWSGGWSAWELLGGSLGSGPGAVSWGPNRVDVVAQATDHSMQHWYWNGSWKHDSLGGSNFVGDPDIASWSEGRLDVFARRTDGQLWTDYWDGTKWSGWISLAGIGPELSSGPSAVSWGPGRIDVVARLTDNTIGHWWYDGSWHYYQPALFRSREFANSPDIASDGANRLDIFARGTDGNLWHASLRSVEVDDWTGWNLVGGPIASGPGAVSWGANRFDVVARDPSNNSVDHFYWQP